MTCFDHCMYNATASRSGTYVGPRFSAHGYDGVRPHRCRHCWILVPMTYLVLNADAFGVQKEELS